VQRIVMETRVAPYPASQARLQNAKTLPVVMFPLVSVKATRTKLCGYFDQQHLGQRRLP
jgi:hypothetical protein